MNMVSQAGEPALRALIYYPISDIWIYLLAVVVLQSLAVYTWRYRQMPAARYLSLSLVTRVVWLVALVMITVSPAFADKIRWAVIHQLGALTVIPLVLMTALHITGQRPAIIRAASALLLIIAGFFALAILTGDWHEGYWRSLPWDGTTFGFVRGPLFWTAMAIAYLTITITLVLYLRQAVRTSGLRRWQILAVPIDMLVSAAGHARWVTNPQTDSIPALPLAFMLGGLFWFGIFFGLRVFNLQELAEATVTQDTNDCLIVIDAQGYIVELNPAAMSLFGERAGGMLGTRVESSFFPWPALATIAEGCEARTGEISVAEGYYLCRMSILIGWGSRRIGKAIVLQDIGELKRVQAKMIEQEKALSIMVERDRLGRELHDGPGQVWNFIGMKLRTVQTLLAVDQSEQAKQEIDRLLVMVGEMNTEARESIVGLKLAGDTGDDFIAKLRDYLAWYRDSTDIDVELALLPDWTEKTVNRFREVQLLRIIQEALTNIRKHAEASHVRVSIDEDCGRLVVLIEDNGCGFDTAAMATKASFGLKLMAERAEEAGGCLAIESSVGTGTRVTVSFDL